MERRSFLKSATAAGVTAVIGVNSSNAELAAKSPLPATRPESPDMIYRELGKTGERVSAIGLGGYHVGKQADANESIRLIRQAIDRGITFMDNCWDYHDGLSETRMGKALLDGYRKKVFQIGRAHV